MTETVDRRTVASKARELVIDLLGDYSRHHGGEIRLRALVALAEELGVAANTTRVVAGRLREEGLLQVRREGRESIYGLSPHLLRTLEVGARRVFESQVRPWDGRWATVVYTVPVNDRRTRDMLRKKLSWLGFGPLAPATWISPHDLHEQAVAECADLPDACLELLTMTSTGLAADRALVEKCWNLAPLNQEYEQYIGSLRRDFALYRAASLDGAAAHGHRIRLVSAYRDFPHRDPDLPPELHPAGWLGAQARDLFLQVHQLLATPARRHYDDVVALHSPSTEMAR